MRALPALMSFVVIGGIMFLLMRRNRGRFTNVPLRHEIQAGPSLSTSLDHVSILGADGFGGTRGQWIRFRGPKWLAVSADAFRISLPGASREFAFTGRESSIAFSQARSRMAKRDWIVITGEVGGRQVRLAITKKSGLLEIWQALAETGAAQS